jgi:BirA family biotin operon repressor/biotin-[acetyl-CoA-carboxylase] ligase
LFNKDKFKSALQTQWLGSDFRLVEESESTNTQLKEAESDDVSHGTVLLAMHQTSGRGQYQRDWISEKGSNLTFTMAFRPRSADRIALLTLACAYAINNFVEEKGLSPMIKWPNDNLVSGKKVAGILTECIFVGSNIDRILIGIGLNVNQKSFEKGMALEATSMAIETKKEFSLEHTLAELLSRIEHQYTRWHQKDESLPPDINHSMYCYGEWVKLSVDGEPAKGIYKFMGISRNGELVVLNQELEVHTFLYEQVRITSVIGSLPDSL